MLLKKILSVFLFLSVFGFPLIIQYFAQGVVFSGNIFVQKYAYIQGLPELSEHFERKFIDYILIFKNPILIFFFIAFLVQRIMVWTISDD